MTENLAATAAEIADNIVDHPRKLVFVALMVDDKVISSTRTTDFPDSDLPTALKQFRDNARNIITANKHNAIKGVDAVSMEVEDATPMGT